MQARLSFLREGLFLANEAENRFAGRAKTAKDGKDAADDPASANPNAVGNVIDSIRGEPSRNDDEHEDASDDEQTSGAEFDQFGEFLQSLDLEERENAIADQSDEGDEDEDPGEKSGPREGGVFGAEDGTGASDVAAEIPATDACVIDNGGGSKLEDEGDEREDGRDQTGELNTFLHWKISFLFYGVNFTDCTHTRKIRTPKNANFAILRHKADHSLKSVGIVLQFAGFFRLQSADELQLSF